MREVIEKSRPIADVARENGLVAQTLGNWVNAWRAEHADDEPVLTLSERSQLKELEREVRELRTESVNSTETVGSQFIWGSISGWLIQYWVGITPGPVQSPRAGVAPA